MRWWDLDGKDTNKKQIVWVLLSAAVQYRLNALLIHPSVPVPSVSSSLWRLYIWRRRVCSGNCSPLEPPPPPPRRKSSTQQLLETFWIESKHGEHITSLFVALTFKLYGGCLCLQWINIPCVWFSFNFLKPHSDVKSNLYFYLVAQSH